MLSSEFSDSCVLLTFRELGGFFWVLFLVDIFTRSLLCGQDIGNMSFVSEPAIVPAPAGGHPRGGSGGGRLGPRPRMGHFDPDELTRRLYGVLSEQKAHSERRRRAQLAQAHGHAPGQGYPHGEGGGDGGQYRPSGNGEQVARVDRREGGHHHVPRDAAKQFGLATTVELMRENTVNGHENGYRNNNSRNKGPYPDANQVAARRRMGPEDTMSPPSQRNRHLQYPTEGVEAWRRAMPVEGRSQGHGYSQSQSHAHTQRHDPMQGAPSSRRRNSTGSAVSTSAPAIRPATGQAPATKPVTTTAAAQEDADTTTQPPTHENRPDWAQADESSVPSSSSRTNNDSGSSSQSPSSDNPSVSTNASHGHGHGHSHSSRPKILLSPLLKRADSLWGLRGRLGSSNHGAGKDGGGGSGSLPSPKDQREQQVVSPTSGGNNTKSPKYGFFAKFVRQ